MRLPRPYGAHAPERVLSSFPPLRFHLRVTGGRDEPIVAFEFSEVGTGDEQMGQSDSREHRTRHETGNAGSIDSRDTILGLTGRERLEQRGHHLATIRKPRKA